MEKITRVAFVFTKTCLNLFDKATLKNSEHPLRDPIWAQRTFQILEGKDANASLYSYPWENKMEQNHFWTYYLQNSMLDQETFREHIGSLYYKLNNYRLWFMEKDITDGFQSKKIDFVIKPYLFRHGFSIVLYATMEEDGRLAERMEKILHNKDFSLEVACFDEKEKENMTDRKSNLKGINNKVIKNEELTIKEKSGKTVSVGELFKNKILHFEKHISEINEEKINIEKENKTITKYGISLKSVGDLLINHFMEHKIKIPNNVQNICDPFLLISFNGMHFESDITSELDCNMDDKLKGMASKIVQSMGDSKCQMLPIRNKRIQGLRAYFSDNMRILIHQGEDSVKCYFMNLLKLSIQLQSMGTFLDEFMNPIPNKGQDDLFENDNLKKHVRLVYRQIKKLYGCPNTKNRSGYMSKSTIAMVNDHYLTQMNYVRSVFALEELSKMDL